MSEQAPSVADQAATFLHGLPSQEMLGNLVTLAELAATREQLDDTQIGAASGEAGAVEVILPGPQQPPTEKGMSLVTTFSVFPSKGEITDCQIFGAPDPNSADGTFWSPGGPNPCGANQAECIAEILSHHLGLA